MTRHRTDKPWPSSGDHRWSLNCRTLPCPSLLVLPLAVFMFLLLPCGFRADRHKGRQSRGRRREGLGVVVGSVVDCANQRVCTRFMKTIRYIHLATNYMLLEAPMQTCERLDASRVIVYAVAVCCYGMTHCLPLPLPSPPHAAQRDKHSAWTATSEHTAAHCTLHHNAARTLSVVCSLAGSFLLGDDLCQ